MDVRKRACAFCPYRRDVPSGLWSADQYDLLRPYDNPTTGQPPNGFVCHSSTETYCHGWAVVGTSQSNSQDLFALRIEAASRRNQEQLVIPEASTALFASHGEAADHGQQDIENPGPDAIQAAAKLMKKYERLTDG